jgi:DNA modification methylase
VADRIGSLPRARERSPVPREALCERVRHPLVLSTPGGRVWDPFSGSGTTAAVALRHGRNAIASDIRASQIDLTSRRIAEVRAEIERKSA